MITHFLGDQEVAAYCRDFIVRVNDSTANFPLVWVVLGDSGKKLGDALQEELAHVRPDLAGSILYLVARYDRQRDQIEYSTPTDDIEWPDAPVLALDSAVHSGQSMLRLVRSLHAIGANNVISYGLVLKAGSAIVPTYFGMIIDDKDRAYFQLKDLPNNRLGSPPPAGLLREITPNDVDRPIERVGDPFVELTVGDFVYDAETKHSKIYIFEKDEKIVGFINFRKVGSGLFIDAWATGADYQKLGIGSATMRWAETWARAKKCEYVELWAFSSAIATYLKHGYFFTDDKVRSLGSGQEYKIMRKKILYNIKPASDDELARMY